MRVWYAIGWCSPYAKYKGVLVLHISTNVSIFIDWFQNSISNTIIVHGKLPVVMYMVFGKGSWNGQICQTCFSKYKFLIRQKEISGVDE